LAHARRGTEAAMKSTFAAEKLRGHDTEGTITYTFKPNSHKQHKKELAQKAHDTKEQKHQMSASNQTHFVTFVPFLWLLFLVLFVATYCSRRRRSSDNDRGSRVSLCTPISLPSS
jgi:hypothetical protein